MEIVVAKINHVSLHPRSKKLKICFVTTGKEETQVISGADNIRENMLTILAMVGSTTPQGLTISPRLILDEESRGILCSAKELKISQETGIVDLPEYIPLGTPFTEISPELLSSTPWYKYKEVDAFWQDQQSDGALKIVIQRGPGSDFAPPRYLLLSKTYYFEGKYLYRHFHH